MMKVIANLGLCISVYDITSIDGGFVFPGDGASTYTVYVGKKTYVDTQYSMFIHTYLKLGLKTYTWHQSRIHSFSRKWLLLKTERERR